MVRPSAVVPTPVKRKLLDALDDVVSFDLPPSLLDAEAKQIAHQLWHEENPDVQGHDHEKIEPTDEHKKLAERRVRLGLLLAELGRKNEIQVTDSEMTQAVMNQARQYPGQERQFFEFVQQNQQMQQQISPQQMQMMSNMAARARAASTRGVRAIRPFAVRLRRPRGSPCARGHCSRSSARTASR